MRFIRTSPALPSQLQLFCFCFLALTSLAQGQWWKGNLHTHSLWSDGDDYPEMIVGWYKNQGYHFLSLSDHNVMLEGDKWIDAATNRGGTAALDKYTKLHGDWVQRREINGRSQVRLKTLEEFRGKFEVKDKFLLIAGEEISDQFEKLPIHLNATHLRELIPPQGGNSVTEVLQNNIDAVQKQRKKTGQPMIPHINHPNFIWALTAEDMVALQGEKFFEVYNGHPVVNNNGDTNRASTERIWDILLTRRLSELRLEPIWGTAVDDAHNYHAMKIGESNPGRGWIMVRAPRLTPEAIIEAMEKGDFYASSGVRLKEIRRNNGNFCIQIDAEPGVTYRTQFIGTRKGYDPKSESVMHEGKPLRTTRRYSADIGAVLAEVSGPDPCYQLKGDEIYVRAKIVSSKTNANGSVAEEVETAWVQPVVTGR